MFDTKAATTATNKQQNFFMLAQFDNKAAATTTTTNKQIKNFSCWRNSTTTTTNKFAGRQFLQIQNAGKWLPISLQYSRFPFQYLK
jgi:hypothetical protein